MSLLALVLVLVLVLVWGMLGWLAWSCSGFVHCLQEHQHQPLMMTPRGLGRRGFVQDIDCLSIHRVLLCMDSTMPAPPSVRCGEWRPSGCLGQARHLSVQVLHSSLPAVMFAASKAASWSFAHSKSLFAVGASLDAFSAAASIA
jgi:hypothetical protein